MENYDVRMVRRPTYAGAVGDKDNADIFYWATEKTPVDRLSESWRLHCLNHGVEFNIKLDKKKNRASLRNDQYI